MIREMLIDIISICLVVFFAFITIAFIINMAKRFRIAVHFKMLLLRIKILMCKKNRHMKPYKLGRNDVYTTHYERSYGRKIIRNKETIYRKKLFLSWGVCFVVGMVIGATVTFMIGF